MVLIGLNRAGELAAPFVNFHAPTRKHYDYRLKEFIQDGDLQAIHGAYMTDLVDTVDTDSSQVEITEADATTFLEQLQLLGRAEYHGICFGNKPFEGLTDYFDIDATELPHELRYARATVDEFTLHLYRCWFYGLYGANQEKVEILRRQLQHLNDRISDDLPQSSIWRYRTATWTNHLCARRYTPRHMNDLERAIALATKVHAGQTDKAGATYIRHPLRVMAQMETAADRVVAVLHDVVEDSEYEPADIEEQFDTEVRDAVEALTKQDDDDDYMTFIERAASNPIARRVKIADIEDNMDLTRLDSVDESVVSNQQKYHEARLYLQQAGDRA